MRKPLLLIAVALTTAITSCQKPSPNNNPFVCTCDYGFQRPVTFFYVKDTTVSVTYAVGASYTDAQLYCNNTLTQYRADPFYHDPACYIHQ